ncbi:YndM family protein [Bacillus haynesii]|uniref:YndM family protein n=1 Tax=Bacillus haynesii TaxID=1925021 RepID=UPI00227E5024|nr:YndM family protein [Bacillus haynesii]MCY7816847.1 YndM family protein [Bacillus haynesii]MCY8223843.1 YndM family protein [Bacillus haynesii]MCY8243777.1 YndM family protein [Bacillus haynesii]MCY8372889.1 YndM family protein [Bacillus haynesii]MCY8569599.1 YndM family protein [Bacillus haynesii]
MKHVRALCLKFIVSLVLLYVILTLFFGVPFGEMFVLTLFLGVISYLIGDLLLLPRTNNTTATMGDFGLSLVLIWAILAMQNNPPYGTLAAASIVAAIGVTVFEYFFHRYMEANVLDETKNGNRKNREKPGSLQYQSEASEELYPVTPSKKQDKE